MGMLTDQSVATPKNDQTALHRYEAQGTVFVPEGMPLTLVIDGRDNPETLEIPSIFEKIDGKEFCELLLKGAPLGAQERGLSAEDSVAQILRTAAHWSNLQSVILRNLPENKAAIDVLNNLKHFRKLELTDPQVDPAELARQPFIGRLEELSLRNLFVDDVVRSLSGSSNLRSLILAETSVSPAALEELRRCPHLVYLQLEENKVDDRLLRAVAQLTTVRHVYIKDASLSPSQIGILTQCPWFELIALDKSSAASASNLPDRRIRIIQDDSWSTWFYHL